MAQLEDVGFDVGPDREIERARWQLWFARMRESGAVGAAGGYLVDPERAQGCIDELNRILENVRITETTAWACQFDPPGYDDVSMNVARNGALMAARARAYITEWANQIEATRDALQRQLDAYRAVEDQSADRLA